MKVFVVSDTHDRLSTLEKFLDTLKSVRGPAYLVHLGDVVSPFTLKLIAESLPEGFGLKVVLGNNDADKVLLSRISDVVDQPEELELCGLKVLAFHGFKSPELTEKMATWAARDGHYDIVMYGHTHRFRLERLRSSHLLNPGALSGYLAERATYAVIECVARRVSVIDLSTGAELLGSTLPKKLPRENVKGVG